MDNESPQGESVVKPQGAGWKMPELRPPQIGPPPTVNPAPEDPQKKSNEATFMMIVGGGGAAVAAFLPWYSVGAFTVNGTAGDGQITLVLGGILALLGLLRRTGKSFPLLLAFIVAGMIFAIGGYHYVSNSDEELVSIGIGIYGTIGAGVVGFVGAIQARQNPIAAVVPTAAPPGWYRDPTGAVSTLRYWDGTTWTEHTAQYPE